MIFHRCNGVLGTCPPIDVTVINLQGGQASLTRSNFASSIVFQSNTNKLHLKLSGFSVTCSTFSVKWSLIKPEEDCLLTEKTQHYLLIQIITFLPTLIYETQKDTKSLFVQLSNIRGEFG